MQNLSSLSQTSAGNITCSKNFTVTGTATLNGAVDLTGATVTGMTLSASVVAPDDDNGAALGSTSLKWSDLFLASGAVINFDSGDVTLTHSATGKLAVASTWAVAAATGEMFSSILTTNVSLGSYANAFFAKVDCQSVGGATGLLSAGCFEIVSPTTGIAGTTAGIEIEMGYGATCGALQKPCFMYLSTYGTAAGDFDTYGDIFKIQGVTAATGKVVGAGASTLRIGTGALAATKRYIPLSTAGDSFTTAYPIVSSYGTTAISINGAETNAIEIITSTPACGILISATCATAISISAQTTTGIAFAGGASYNPIHIGAKDNVKDKGIVMVGATDDTGGVMIFADDGGVALGSVTSPIWTRYLITASQSGGATATGMFAQTKSMAVTFTTGSYTALKAFYQVGGATTLVSGAELAIINAGMSLEGAITQTSGRLSGVDVNINTATNAITDTATDTAGIHIRKTSASTYGWPVGLKINDSGAVTGIEIGNCTYGIVMSGTCTNALRITTSHDTSAHTTIRVLDTYTAASGYHTAIMGAAIYNPTAASGYGAVIGVYGEANIQGDFTGGTNWSFGVRGTLQLTNDTVINNGSSIFGAINASMKDDASPTLTAGHVCGIYIDNLIDADLSGMTGISAMIYSANNASATCTLNYGWYHYGPGVTNLLGLYDCTVGGCVSVGGTVGTHGTNTKKIAIDIDGDTYYLLASTVPTFT